MKRKKMNESLKDSCEKMIVTFIFWILILNLETYLDYRKTSTRGT